MPLTRSVERRR